MPAHARRSWTRFPAALALTGLAASLLASGPASAQGGRLASQVHVIQTSLEVPNGLDAADVEIQAIPAGKRFVVELLTASAKIPTGQGIRLILTREPAGANHLVFIPLLLQMTVGTLPGFINDFLHAYLPGRFYIDAGAPALRLVALRPATTGSDTVALTLSGYLVDLPPAP